MTALGTRAQLEAEMLEMDRIHAELKRLHDLGARCVRCGRDPFQHHPYEPCRFLGGLRRPEEAR